ncbi:MAG: ATP-binding protein [Clostridia bacterium]|nr:ATP-binding protein [Clostridia bacterium]
MILSVRVNNYMVYSREVELSLCADENITRFDDNVFTSGEFRVLKSACVYGANNSGKTCLVSAVECIKNVILDRLDKAKLQKTNIFAEDQVCGMGVSFLTSGRAFSFDFKYDNRKNGKGEKRGFVYECLKELHPNGDSDEIYLRDTDAGTYRFKDGKISEDIMRMIPTDRIFIYGATGPLYDAMTEYKDALVNFARNLSIINANSVPLKKTLNALKNDTPLKSNIVELIKLADIDIEDFKYIKTTDDCDEDTPGDEDSDDDEYESTEELIKYVNMAGSHLYSRHRGRDLRSLLVDSSGTNKVIAMAGYIVDALQNGKTLVIDEFDSGLHFELTKAVALLFNSTANKTGGQLIFMTHDATLMDCETLFRQDQIWFVCKDNEKEYLYALADYGYDDEDVSSAGNLADMYRRGALGPVPRPDFPSMNFERLEK